MSPRRKTGPERRPAPLIDQDELLRRNRGLRLLDDIFMQACFQNEPRCVERILRVILGKDLRARRVSLQKSLKNLHGRSVVMDVLAVDEQGKLYNIEIQTGLPGANARRPSRPTRSWPIPRGPRNSPTALPSEAAMDEKKQVCPNCGGMGDLSTFRSESRFMLTHEECPFCFGFG